MYIDKAIKINDKIPAQLKIDLNEVDRLYNNNDEIHAECLLDSLEGDIKECVASGRLSREEGIQLFQRYGYMP